MRTKRTRLNEALNYVASVREEILCHENALREIIQGDEWKRTMNYLRVAAYNGVIDDIPMKGNDYRVPIIIDVDEK